MRSADPTSSASGAGKTAPEPNLAVAHSHIMSLARAESSVPGFLKKAVAYVGEQLASPFTTLYARTGSTVIQEETHRGETDPRFWHSAAQRFLTDCLADGRARAKLLSAKNADLKIALLFAPLTHDAHHLSGAIAAVVRGGEQEAGVLLHRLESLAAAIASSLELVGATARDDAGSSAANSPAAVARGASMSSPEELAFALTNSLRAKLGLEQVVLGTVTHGRVRILSISGLDDINRRSPGVVQIRAAMEECLDFNEPIVCQHDRGLGAEKLTRGHRLHRQWHGAAAGDGVGTIPLRDGGRYVGVLGLRWRGDQILSQQRIDEIVKIIEPYAATLQLVQRARRGLLRHAWDSLGAGCAACTRPGRLGTKLLALLTLAGLAWFCFGELDYRPTVPARIVPAQQRHLVTPFEGMLVEALVTAGDFAHKGDVLCRFDTRDLELQRAELRAQLAVCERERMRAMAENRPVEAKLAEANQHLVQARLEIIELRMGLATIRAPYDGIVIRGDLRTDIGRVFVQGAPLFEIAPLNQWKLELDAPESIVSGLRVAAVGRFASYARPESTQPFAITRLCPSAEVRDGNNVYVAEACFECADRWLRPGMEGVAKIEMGSRKVWWVTLHSMIDYVRLHYWL